MLALFLLVFVSVAAWGVVLARRGAARTGPIEWFASDRAVAVGFGAWALAAFLAAAAALTILSIGLLLAPLAVVALWVAGRFSPSSTTLFGALAGVGIFMLFVAVIRRAGGPDRVTWSVAGALCVAAGIAGCLLLHRQRRSSSM